MISEQKRLERLLEALESADAMRDELEKPKLDSATAGRLLYAVERQRRTVDQLVGQSLEEIAVQDDQQHSPDEVAFGFLTDLERETQDAVRRATTDASRAGTVIRKVAAIAISVLKAFRF